MALPRLILFLGVVWLFTSCNNSSDTSPDVSTVQVEVAIESLEDSLFACQSVEAMEKFLARYPFLSQVYFPDVAPQDSSLAPVLYEHIRNTSLRGFKEEVDSLFSDKNQQLRQPLETAFKHIKYYYPRFKAPRVVTLVTGFMGSDLYISDSLIIIGLDYFGGPQATYRPQVYAYQLGRYQKEYLVPSILFFMADQYNRTDPADKTLLADMIGYGKSFEFVKRCAPQTPDSLVLGFSEKNLTRTYNSQTAIWAFVVENRLLYEKAQLVKQKYVGERPFTPEIGPDVPGGIGRWLGWRIVSRYMEEHPDVTLPELMNNPNAQQILQQSGYKGQMDE
ncbi:gliding motility lipoprotein GldB [Salmonirosea aquatica]|uniref:Gliding motility protein n=1 Tax=Salmonirosea aquatica TaxID=2654236 RepID=A0A7C9F8P1_9BACT|nr:gliding motility protein [Cytophagaceae bacterium SJW1-29]